MIPTKSYILDTLCILILFRYKRKFILLTVSLLFLHASVFQPCLDNPIIRPEFACLLFFSRLLFIRLVGLFNIPVNTNKVM